jgi:hypothetical protein
MEAALIGEETILVFVIITPPGEELFVTWNKHNHTENRPDALSYIPEYVVEDDFENELEQGCQDWLDAVAAVKEWQQKQDLI